MLIPAFPDAIVPTATAWLPDAALHANLLRWFAYYITAAFLTSTFLRLRFYHSIYRVANHVRQSCPNIVALLTEHWNACLCQGLFYRVGGYVGVLLAYEILIWFVLPGRTLTLANLADVGAGPTALVLLVTSAMISIDVFLIAQVGVIDANRIKSDLTTAEGWLGGRVSEWMRLLGEWNPIKHYADYHARKSMSYFNMVFRGGLENMILQLSMRAVAAGSLIVSCFLAT